MNDIFSVSVIESARQAVEFDGRPFVMDLIGRLSGTEKMHPQVHFTAKAGTRQRKLNERIHGLLSFFSLIEVACASGIIDLSDIPERAHIHKALLNASFHEYYELINPAYLVIMFAKRLQGSEQLNISFAHQSAEAYYSHLCTITRQYHCCSIKHLSDSIGDERDNVNWKDILRLINSPRDLVALAVGLARGKQAIVGEYYFALRDFICLSAEFDHLLNSINEPLTRSAFYHVNEQWCDLERQPVWNVLVIILLNWREHSHDGDHLETASDVAHNNASTPLHALQRLNSSYYRYPIESLGLLAEHDAKSSIENGSPHSSPPLTRLQEGAMVKGIVKQLTDYGAFVDLGGVDGLVHLSDMTWGCVRHPSEIVNVGDEIDVKVLKYDRERNSIPLGIKQCTSNPWEEFFDQFNEGDKISGTIESITDFGILVALNDFIVGLVHLSDISWSEVSEEALLCFKKGDPLETVILSIEPERGRIYLGIKQLEEDDPFSAYVTANGKGAIVRGVVKKVDVQGAVITLAYGVEASVSKSEISRHRVADARQILKKGDDVSALILSVDRKTNSIQLSIRAANDVTRPREHPFAEAVPEQIPQTKARAEHGEDG
ncbi:MAG: ribosomal protein [Pseudomonas sp.]|nr:ribosomal protein [Pseudomonas sp.]